MREARSADAREALGTVCLLGTIIFSLTSVHKLAAATGRAPMPAPLLATPWRRQHAIGLARTASLIEACVAVLLILRPAAGLATSAGVLAGYAVAIAPMERSSECGCFGSIRTSVASALRRNVALALALAGLALANWFDRVPQPVPLSSPALIAAILILTAVTGWSLSLRLGLPGNSVQGVSAGRERAR